MLHNVRRGRERLFVVIASIAALVLAMGATLSVSGQPESTTYYACLYAGSLSQVGTVEPPNCGRGMMINWNSIGPEGVQGPQGLRGPEGSPGATGPQGLPGEPGMVWRGDYSASVAYSADDVVAYEGSSYISLVDNNQGVAPDTLNGWDLVAREGEQGPPGSIAGIAEQRCDAGLFVFGVDSNGDIMCRTVEAPPFRTDCPDPELGWDSGVDLSRCDYAGVVVPGIAPLIDANLNNANFTGADLTADFSRATLQGAYFDGADLTSSVFIDANLSYATMQDANLFAVNFSGANLTNVLLQGSDLFGANFTNANLTNANLYGAVRANLATTWTGATFSNTICPSGVNSDANGGTCTGQLTAP